MEFPRGLSVHLWVHSVCSRIPGTVIQAWDFYSLPPLLCNDVFHSHVQAIWLCQTSFTLVSQVGRGPPTLHPLCVQVQELQRKEWSWLLFAFSAFLMFPQPHVMEALGLHLTHSVWRIKGKLWHSSLSLLPDQAQYHHSPISNHPHYGLFDGWFQHILMGCNTTSTDKATSSLKGISKVRQEGSRCLWQAIRVTEGVHTTQLPPPILPRALVRAQAVPRPPLSVDSLRWGWCTPGAAAESNWETQQSEGIWSLL